MRVTLNEIAERKGVTWHAIRKRKLKEGWQACGKRVVNHKPADEFELSSLPNDLKTLFPEYPGNIAVVDGVETQPPYGPSAASSSDQEQSCDLPPDQLAPVQPYSVPAQSLQNNPENATGLAQLTDDSAMLSKPKDTEIFSPFYSARTEASPLFPKNDIPITAIPEKAKQIALARMDILRIWETFRGRYDSLAQGDKEFAQWYQTGHGAPHLYNILGDISVAAIRKWKKSLAGSSDWRNLVPHYKWSGMVLQTSLDIQVRKIFERFLLDPRRQKIAQCIFYTREALNLQGIECDAADAAFYRYVDWFKKTHNDVWTFRREGNKALVDKVLLYIKRDAAMLDVGDCLVADGHRLNFQIINPFTGKPCRATMIAYLDWKSYDIAGYEIMIEENTQAIASALRHAMMKLGKRPRFTYQDNGKSFRARFFTSCPSFEEAGFFGLFARFNIIPVFSLPYCARSKVIERWWGIFSESFERLMPSYIGASIEDKPAYMKQNEKYHKALRGEYTPTIWEAVELINQWLSLWSTKTECPHLPGKSIRQVFDEGKGQGIAQDELDDLMLDTKITKIYQNGIRMWGEYYWHEALYGKKFDDVTIKYSIFDRSAVRVYAKNGALICTAAKTSEMNPLVNYLGTEAERDRFKNVLEIRGRLRKGTIAMAKQIEEAPVPIAVNMTALPIIDGPKPGALMMQQAEEKRNNIDILKAGAKYTLADMMPEHRKESKIFLWESDRQREEALQAETDNLPEQDENVLERREFKVVSLKKDLEDQAVLRTGTDDAEQWPIKQPTTRRGLAIGLDRRRAMCETKIYRAGILEVDLSRAIVKAGEVVLDLLPQDFRLLCVLIAHRGRVFSRQELLRSISHSSDELTVNVAVRRLRVCLAKVGCKEYVITRRGLGYLFSETD